MEAVSWVKSPGQSKTKVRMRYRLCLKKEKAYPATRAQVPIPDEGTYLVEVLVGLTAVRLLASLLGSLPLRDASTILEWGMVEKEADPTRFWVSLPEFRDRRVNSLRPLFTGFGQYVGQKYSFL